MTWKTLSIALLSIGAIVASLATGLSLYVIYFGFADVATETGRTSGGLFGISNSTRLVLEGQHSASAAPYREYSAVNAVPL